MEPNEASFSPTLKHSVLSLPRRNLVVVRAGKNSLHPRWLESAHVRNWDLIVSLFDPQAKFDHGDDIEIVTRPGGKWDGLYYLFQNSDLLERYDYIWLPDDDIDTDAPSIDAIFNNMKKFNLDIAQPSLTRDSFYTHFLCLSCLGFYLRYTNFVEIMVPCLRASVLKTVLNDFEDNMSGFGLDYIWCRLTENGFQKSAIIDQVQVRHTRPIGQALRGAMRKIGRSPEDDKKRLLTHYGLMQPLMPLVYAALDQELRLYNGAKQLGLKMAMAYIRTYMHFTVQEPAHWKIYQLVKRQFIGELDLSQVNSRRSP